MVSEVEIWGEVDKVSEVEIWGEVDVVPEVEIWGWVDTLPLVGSLLLGCQLPEHILSHVYAYIYDIFMCKPVYSD